MRLLVLAFAAAAANALTDTDILNYALTLEHLENAFYSGGLAKFNQSSFANPVEHTLFQQIGDHEATHVATLQSILGDAAVKPCNYSFPYTDAQGFKALAMVLEGVGTSAYLGAAQFISSKDVLTAAGSILTTEARHAAWIASVNGQDPWSGAFDAPLSTGQVVSLAAPFIGACPASNPPLPVKPFPALTASPASNLTGAASVTLSVPAGFDAKGKDLWAAFLTGTSVAAVPYTVNGSVSVPPAVNSTGTTYVVITTSNSTANDDTTVAGPAILMFNGLAGAASSGSSGGGSAGSGGTTSDNSTGAAGRRTQIVGVTWIVALAVFSVV